MSDNMKLNGQAEAALNSLQDTQLSPMEETLFKAWTKANDIKDPDAPDDIVDYRGIYKQTGGQVMPYGQLRDFTKRLNHEDKLQRLLQQQMLDRIQKAAGSAEDAEKDQFKAERQDVTHKQKVEMEQLKLKRVPHEAKMKEFDVKAKEMDIEKMRVGNEGKEIDFMKGLMTPAGGQSGTAKTKSGGTTPSGNSK